VRTLAANRQAATVPEPAIATEIHQAFDVDSNLAAQVAFDLAVRVNMLADRQNLGVRELIHPAIFGYSGGCNPIGCEQIVGLARLLRANAMAALENVALWHERDISHSSVERVILPDSFIALDHMLRRFTRIVSGMVVYPARMRENLERSRGVVFSGQVLLELAKRGISREQAYEWVQRNAMRAFHDQTDFKSLLLEDADVQRVLSAADVERAFDRDEQLRNVDAIFARVFVPALAGTG
jgi:adenylosuccinate lyase